MELAVRVLHRESGQATGDGTHEAMKHWVPAIANQLLLDASVGLLSGVMRVLGAVSIATLLFPGKLSRFFLIGVSIGLSRSLPPT